MFIVAKGIMENSKDYLIGLLKDKYDYELVRKNDLDAALNIPITILTALLAGLYVVASDSSLRSASCHINTIKWLLFILLFLSCATTIFLLFKVYFGYKRSYCAFPESNTVYNVDFKYLEEHNREHNADTYDETLTDHLKDYVVKWYLDCNNNNTPVNDRRGDAMFYARLGLCISISLGLVLLILVCYIKSL
ncbi:hypothetical protein HDC92_001612 [Pedobacter sp. AK017]|nr:hypothetical protein [Pedobacter sp. AK017]